VEFSRRHILKFASVPLLPFSSYRALSEERPGVHSADALVESLGVCVHLSYSNTVYGRFEDIIFPLMRDLGIRYARDGIPTGQKINSRGWQYVRGRKLVEIGVRFSCVTSDGLVFPTTLYSQLEDAFEWYTEGVAMIEGANESNLTRKPNWQTAVVEHQRALYSCIKQSSKLRQIPVAGPSLFIPGNDPAGNYADAVDFGNVHAYPGFAHPESTREGDLDVFIRGAEKNTGSKPIIVSETGYHAALQTTSRHPPVSEPVIARYLPRLALNCFRKNIHRTFIYELADTYNKGPADKESNFGLARATGEPKPGYVALKNLIALFSDKGASLKTRPLGVGLAGPNTSDVFMVIFQRSNREYLVPIWLGIRSWDPASKEALAPSIRPLSLRLDRSMKLVDVTTFDDTGNVKTEKKGSTARDVAVNVSDQLTVLRLVEAS
jgi:hypothetical protein